MISIVSKSDTLSDFDLRNSKSDAVSEFDTMDIIVKMCHQKACGIVAQHKNAMHCLIIYLDNNIHCANA